LTDYLRLGYVSNDFVRAGNRTLEYAYDDYCLAQVAKGLGENGTFQRYLNQSDNWKNLWRPVSDEGFVGFIMPRDTRGNWIDSILCTGSGMLALPYTPHSYDWPKCVCWWCGFFYEGTSWEYSFLVPHDVAGLVAKCGGPETFRKRLDHFFEHSYYNVSNEPCFLTPCLYHWVGHPEMSGERIRTIIEKHYNDSPGGIPGNDDSGAMSSWLVFHMMGMYPNAGQSYYLLHAPLVEESVLQLADNRLFRIKAKDFSPENIYVQSVLLNGKSYDRSWIEHAEIVGGGELVFTMGPKPSTWGIESSPPSK
jgi:predicted alpha-1,2-mannosidase